MSNMKLYNNCFSNQYISSPKIIIHHIHHTIKTYGLFLFLSIIPLIKTNNLTKIFISLILIIIYNKQFICYFQDFQYIFIISMICSLLYVKIIPFKKSINFFTLLITILPSYFIRIILVIFIYFITLRILFLTTPSEYLVIYLLDFIIAIIYINSLVINIFLLITSCSYQLLDRLIYNLQIIQLFIHINQYNKISKLLKINKKVIMNLINKYIQNLLRDVEKISYTLYNRKLNTLDFYFNKR